MVAAAATDGVIPVAFVRGSTYHPPTMTDEPIASHSFCVVAGCTDPAVRQRWVMPHPDDKVEVGVCEKHTEGELDINDLELGDWGE